MSIGTFGAFTQARLAIYAAQTGLTMTGNNISNINTEGYTRQRLDQSSLYTVGSDRYYAEGDVRVGQGVLVNGLSQIRSPYLDIRFRRENASVGYMDGFLEGLDSIAAILDEVGKGESSKDEEGFGILGLELDKIRDALEQLTDQTGHYEYDNTVRKNAQALCTKLNTYANKLQEVYNNTVTQLHQDVEEINGYLSRIRNLNEEIRKCDIHGDNALELRDERNLAIDKLSNLINIQVDYSMEEISYGLEVEKLTIRLGNSNPDGAVETDSSVLIDGVYGSQLILEQVPEMRKLDPDDQSTWPYADAKGNPVMTEAEAAESWVKNPKYDANITDKTDERFGEYLKEDGTGTNNKNLAAKEPAANPNYKPYVTPSGEPTDKLEDAKMVDSPNYNITISELRNKSNRLHYVTTKSPEVLLEDAAEIQKAMDALKKGGSITENNTPTTSDVTITTCRASAQGNPNWARYLPYLDANNKPVGDAKDAATDANGKPVPNPAHYPYLDANGQLSMVKGENGKDNPKYEARYLVRDAAGNITGSTNSVADAAKDYYKEIYVRTASKPVELDDNDLHGRIQAHRELLTEAGEFTDLSVITKESGQTGSYRNADENAASKRGIVYFQKSLDLLANQFAKAFNEANQGFLTDPDGNYITTGTNDKGEEIGVPVTVVGSDISSNPVPTITATLGKKTDLADLPPEIIRTLQNATGIVYDPDKGNSQEIIDAYLKGEKYVNGELDTSVDPEPKGIFRGGVLFSNHNAGDDPTGITASNISISHTWSNQDLLVRSFECPVEGLEPASGQSDNILHMLGVLDQDMQYIPNTLPDTGGASDMIMFEGNFNAMFNKIGSTLGADQKLTGNMLDDFYQRALEIDTNRDSVSSVDFNDEAMNLMMYAKSYNAACRLMTTIDSVLDKLINNTGLTT